MSIGRQWYRGSIFSLSSNVKVKFWVDVPLSSLGTYVHPSENS